MLLEFRRVLFRSRSDSLKDRRLTLVYVDIYDSFNNAWSPSSSNYDNECVESIILPYCNTGNIGSESLFKNLKSLKTFSAPLLGGIANHAFQGCSALVNVDLPKLHTIHGKEAFMNCTSLETISLPELTAINGENVFMGCTSLQNVDFPKLNSVFKNTFEGCTSLVKIAFPSATQIDEFAFKGCSSLQTSDYPLFKRIGKKIFDGGYSMNDV